MRVIIHDPPFEAFEEKERRKKKAWESFECWPCRWISSPQQSDGPFVAAYRRRFIVSSAMTIRIHVSADERYELYLDGARIGRGSERGTSQSWFYETYDLMLDEGEHLLAARCWALGSYRPWAQMTVRPGFILAPEGDDWINAIGTGVAPWEVVIMQGYRFQDIAPLGIGTGGKLIVKGDEFCWGFERGEGEGWKAAVSLESGNNGYVLHTSGSPRIMQLAVLPPMVQMPVATAIVRAVFHSLETAGETEEWQRLLEGQAVAVPPRAFRRVAIDLRNYYCFYPELVTSGGKNALIRLSWEEAYYECIDGRGWTKGNRNEIHGKTFRGVGDIFIPDGERHRKWDTLWWHAGRYAELIIETADDPLVIESFVLTETRYPFETESTFRCDDQPMNQLVPTLIRSLQMCSHETYMDCPYWEQLMYAGDTRQEALLTYVLTKDDRLPRKAITMFHLSRQNYTGLVTCAFPDQSNKIIPSFCLWWIGMVYDHALWRGNKPFIAEIMPAVRDVLDKLLRYRNEAGLVRQPKGWTYIDWIPEWHMGAAPEGGDGISCVYNWQLVYTLRLAAELENYIGESELAGRAMRLAGELADATHLAFWDADTGLYADDATVVSFSEHAQSMAILSDYPDEHAADRIREGLRLRKDLSRTSMFYSHYFFEACRKLKAMDLFMNRLEDWFGLERDGFLTTPEHFGLETRSDCHAWGAHPLYHFYTSVIGIRPSTFGFETVRIEPQLVHVNKASADMVHPRGRITLELERRGEELSVEVNLPHTVKGTFIWSGKEILLESGYQTFHFK